MRLLEVSRTCRDNGTRLSATIERQSADETFQAYFDFSVPDETAVSDHANAFAAAMLVPSMRAAEPLTLTPPISPDLCFSLPRIRDLLHVWYPDFHRIELHVTPSTPHSDIVDRAATFFSGGVDSFYSLLKHKRQAGTLTTPLTHIIFMRGVETTLEDSKNVVAAEHWVREIAEQTNVECVYGESNVRTCLQGHWSYIHWEKHYFGSALAAVAHALTPMLGYVCIPSSFSYNHLVAHGSSPLLDEMFSTRSMRVLHDGSEVTRPMKIAKILEWDPELVLPHLRVCIHNSGGAFNCGKCYKCVRTAVVLHALGLWDRATTFPDKSTGHWERVMNHDHLVLTEENLEFAREHGAERKLTTMLERVVRRKRFSEGARTMLQNSALRPLVPVIKKIYNISENMR